MDGWMMIVIYGVKGRMLKRSKVIIVFIGITDEFDRPPSIAIDDGWIYAGTWWWWTQTGTYLRPPDTDNLPFFHLWREWGSAKRAGWCVATGRCDGTSQIMSVVSPRLPESAMNENGWPMSWRGWWGVERASDSVLVITEGKQMDYCGRGRSRTNWWLK